MAAKTTDRDRGLQKIIREMKKAGGAVVLVGIQSDATNSRTEGEPRVAQYAYWNEFGVGVPERPFMRSAFDMATQQITKDMAQAVAAISAGTWDIHTALSMIGGKHEARIKARIVSLNTPPNSPKTIARKKSANPLIDTGVMRQSVRYIVKASG